MLEFLTSIISNEITIIVAIMFLFALIFVILSGTSLRVMPYLYANSRIIAKSKYILDKGKIEKLAYSKNLLEFCKKIQETEYYPEISNKENLFEIQKGVEKGFINSINELIELSPVRMKSLFTTYMMFYEKEFLKRVFELKFNKKKDKIDESEINYFGIITPSFIDRINTSETIADLKVIMASTKYKDVFGEKHTTVLEFENKIDNFVLEHFIKTINKTRIQNKKLISEILLYKSEIVDLITILKSVARKESPVERIRFFAEKDNNLLKKMAKSNTFNDIVENAKNTSYYNVLKKAFDMYQKDNKIFHFEYELNTLYKKRINDNELGNIQGSFPIFSYLAKKDIEKNNLFVISKGIESALEPKEIMELVL